MAAGRKAALGLAALLVMVAWSSAWFEITATGTYEEGLEREPTIRTQYSIDNEEQTFELSIENATPLILYWMQREDIAQGGEPSGNGSERPAAEAGSESDGDDGEPCNGSCMERARNSLALLMVAFVASLAVSALRPSRRADAAAGLSWVACLALIVLGVPMAAAADFGIFGSDEAGESGSSTGGFSSGTSSGVTPAGLVFTYDSTGFDLGLLDEGDRQAVIDSAPSEGQPGYESLIGFHGELVVGPGQIFSWWFLILPIYAYSLRREKQCDEEE
jgi:hypothetical protein